MGLTYYIYCLKNTVDSKEYIGSTKHGKQASIQACLNDRLSKHKYGARRRSSKVYNHINNIGWNNVHIELIERIDCVERFGDGLPQKDYYNEVHKIEGAYIITRKSELNTQIAGRTRNEWKTDKIVCPNCNIELRRDSLKTHNKRKHSS